MKNYFAMLGAKAIGAETGIRARREVLYGSSRSADGLDLGRQITEATTTHDQDEFAVEDAVWSGTAVNAIQASAKPEEGDAHRAGAEAEPSRDDRSASAMSPQIHALQERFANGGDASRDQVRPSSNILLRALAPHRSESAGVSTAVPGAEPDQAERPKSMSVDSSIRYLGAPTGAPVTQAEEVEPVSDHASANAVYRLVTTEANATRSVPRTSQSGASSGMDRPDPAFRPRTGSTIALESHDVSPADSASIDAPSEAAASHPSENRDQQLPQHREAGSRTSNSAQPWLRAAVRSDVGRADRHWKATISASAEAEEEFDLPVVSARIASPQSAVGSTRRTTSAELAVQDAPPSVQVSIGRIEIREQRLAPPAAARRAQPPRMDLKEYLSRRLRGGRHE